MSVNAANTPHRSAALAHRLAGPGCSQRLLFKMSRE